jgi:hypothetical protein
MHKIFSNLKGFVIFEFTVSGNGWVDSRDDGDKDLSDFYESPDDGLGCGDLDGDEEGDGDVCFYYFGDGDFGNGHGSNFNYKSKKNVFCFDDET